MTERSSLVRWLVLGRLVGGLLAGIAIIVAAGVGAIRAQPTLGIIGFACGTVVWLSATWRYARRFRR